MRKIIILTIAFLLLSFVYLSYIETKQQDPASQNFWVVYFENPKDESLDFVIENNSNQKNFHWEVLAENNKLTEGNVEINKGDKEIIPVNISKNNKISIKVTVGEEKKEIYKIFGK